MKLSEYFDWQKSQVMTSQAKSHLFSRIQKEKTIWTEVSAKLPSRMFFFVSKKIMYTSFAAFIFVVVFGGLLLDKAEILDFWIFSIKQNTTSNGVFADYVAEVVEFNWEYSLLRDDITLESKNIKVIQNEDIVTLPIGTDLVFNLQDWTQAKIVWPAEFSITQAKEWYQISLFDGKFFRIYCPECSSDVEIITPDFSISQAKNQTLDLHIAKEENGEMLVKNDGDKITVKTKNSEDKVEITQVSSELISIGPDSEKVDIVSDSDMMIAFMTKNNISATFEISTDKVEWPTIPSNNVSESVNEPQKVEWKIEQSAQNAQSSENVEKNNSTDIVDEDPLLAWIKEVMTSDLSFVWEVDEDLAWNLWLSSEGQQLPSAAQMQELKTNLNGFFLMDIFEGIYTNDKVNQNISKFADRINSVASTFGYSDRASADLSSIKNVSLMLKDKLEKDWYISPSYILQLEKISKWCDELKNPSEKEWGDFSSNLPSHLRLM